MSLDNSDKQSRLLRWVSDETRRRRAKYWTAGNDIEVDN